jgi:hypothetical protein
VNCLGFQRRLENWIDVTHSQIFELSLDGLHPRQAIAPLGSGFSMNIALRPMNGGPIFVISPGRSCSMVLNIHGHIWLSKCFSNFKANGSNRKAGGRR